MPNSVTCRRPDRPWWQVFGLALFMSIGLVRLSAQSVQPPIVEYKGQGEGKFMVTNTTLAPMVVVLQPKSFAISPGGTGIFRDLDAGIHVQLSTTSLKLAPQQKAYVFYKATADRLPAWFTIYATFSSVKHTPGLDVRVMLPHTVYLFQRMPLLQEQIHVAHADYDQHSKKLSFDIQNEGIDLGRVQEVKALSGHGSLTLSGFPLLPGGSRAMNVDWTEKDPPEALEFKFEHFSLKRPVSAVKE